MRKINIITDPIKIKREVMKDDLSQAMGVTGSIQQWRPALDDTLWIQLIEDNKAIGLLAVKPMTDASATFHGGVFRNFRKGNAEVALKDYLNQIRKLIPIKVFWTTVNKDNKRVIDMLKRGKFKLRGIIPNGYMDSDMLIYSEER
jgi:hypothetical protein